MTSCSEYVSLGHPDKTADAIASHLLDEYLKHDPETRFAVEVQLKDHVCNLAGEVTSDWKPSAETIERLVRDAVRKVGYTAEYASRWPDGATLNADNLVVNTFIGRQSPEIAQGVDRKGWGDQGIFMGMATNEPSYDYMPRDLYLARRIGKELYNLAKSPGSPIGLDIKTLVSLSLTKEVEQVIVAAPTVPHFERTARELVRGTVERVLESRGYKLRELLFNGTGSYVVHSSVGDAGVVGRKLAVDFYGLNCPVGGGTTWGKDGTKSDVTLNLAARYFSLRSVLDGEYDSVTTKISCCIGQDMCLMSQQDERGITRVEKQVELSPSILTKKFGLCDNVRDDMFFHLCSEGLFSFVDEIAVVK